MPCTPAGCCQRTAESGTERDGQLPVRALSRLFPAECCRLAGRSSARAALSHCCLVLGVSLPCGVQLWQQLTSGSTLSICCSLGFDARSWLWLLGYSVKSHQHQNREKQIIIKKKKKVRGRASLCITERSGTPSTLVLVLDFPAGQKKPPCPKGYHPSVTRCKAPSLSAPRAVVALVCAFSYAFLHGNHPDPGLACHQPGAGCAECVAHAAGRVVVVRAQAGR